MSIDGHSLAVELRFIEEVFRSGYVTRVPLAPPCMVGLTNLRGQVIPLLDLTKILTDVASSRRPLPDREAVLLRWQDIRVAVLVDATTGVIKTHLDAFYPMTNAHGLVFAGHFRLPKGRLDLLDVKKLVEHVRYQAAVGASLEPR